MQVHHQQQGMPPTAHQVHHRGMEVHVPVSGQGHRTYTVFNDQGMEYTDIQAVSNKKFFFYFFIVKFYCWVCGHYALCHYIVMSLCEVIRIQVSGEEKQYWLDNHFPVLVISQVYSM